MKFLHQEVGFDVLAFESPMYDMTVAWDRLRTGTPPREALCFKAGPCYVRSALIPPRSARTIANSRVGNAVVSPYGDDREWSACLASTARWLPVSIESP